MLTLASYYALVYDPCDSRIFPFWYAPLIVMENGKRVIKPMRYHCRPSGKLASYDKRYDGLYNARRDNLEGSWKALFGVRHGVLVATSFFENVARHTFEKRELAPGEKPENLVLHFNPQTGQDMLLACLWDHWSAPGEPPLDSFTAITDEPPEEIAASGYDRCVIPLTEANLDAWLNPEGRTTSELSRLLDGQPPLLRARTSGVRIRHPRLDVRFPNKRHIQA